MSRTLSIREAARIVGLEERRVRELVRSGLCRPARRGRRYALAFQDLVVLRAARGLLDAKVPAARVRRALAALAAELPTESLSGLRIYADGRNVAVAERGRAWQPETGQILLDFEVDGLARLVDDVQQRRSARSQAASAESAQDAFERALDLEDDAPDEAAAAYRQALELSPDLVDAWVNLGRLVHERGDAREAMALYRQALERSPDDPVVHFNLALALEDAEGAAAAAVAYERALALDPDFAEAHYNLAGLCERLERGADALRHYRAYRDLTGR